MPWTAIFQDGQVKADGTVELSILYRQIHADGSAGQEFQEPMVFGPTEAISQPIVRSRTDARVVILNGREGVVNAIGSLKGQDIATWPLV